MVQLLRHSEFGPRFLLVLRFDYYYWTHYYHTPTNTHLYPSCGTLAPRLYYSLFFLHHSRMVLWYYLRGNYPITASVTLRQLRPIRPSYANPVDHYSALYYCFPIVRVLRQTLGVRHQSCVQESSIHLAQFRMDCYCLHFEISYYGWLILNSSIFGSFSERLSIDSILQTDQVALLTISSFTINSNTVFLFLSSDPPFLLI